MPAPLIPSIMSSDDLRQRVTRVEEKVETNSKILDRAIDTQQRLVKFVVRHEETKSRVDSNEQDVEEALSEVSDLRSYIESRWYVLASIVAAIVLIAELATTFL